MKVKALMHRTSKHVVFVTSPHELIVTNHPKFTLWCLNPGVLLPDPLYGGLLCHGVGTVLLFCTSAMSSLYNSSVDVDGESDAGVPWSVVFLQLVFAPSVSQQVRS